MSRVLFTALAGVLCLAPMTASAQSGATLRGRVVDDAGRPLPDAVITLLNAKNKDQGRTYTTRQDGTFRLQRLAGDAYWLLVRRIGFAPRRLTVTVPPDEDVTLSITMPAMSQVLPDVVVEEQRVSDRLLAYSSSVHNGRSRFFFTREDIERRQPKKLSDLVRIGLPFLGPLSYTTEGIGVVNEFPTSPYTISTRDFLGRSVIKTERTFAPTPLLITRSGANAVDENLVGQSVFRRTGSTSASGRPRLGFDRLSATRRCIPEFFINGVQVATPINRIDPQALEAVEVFRPGRVPIQLDPDEGAGGCGVVLVWLRSSFASPNQSA